MSGFKSVFAKHLTSYVALRRRLGLRFEQQENMLRAFDRFAHEHEYQGPLVEQFVRSFAMAGSDVTTTVPSRRYLVVRHFAEYLATFDPSTPRLDPKAIYRARLQPPPYIFTDEDLARLLSRVADFRQRHPISNRAFHAILGLAASSGLRLREVLGLDLSDVDLETGVLVIRRTKFDKDRLVPVHATTLDVLRAYAAIRDQIPGAIAETAFFLGSRGRRFQVYTVEYLFRQLVRKLELRPTLGKRPTFYSLRHTFAVRRLVAWYRAGDKVQSYLPALATYMGHVHYTSTSYYLTATAELLGVAADRLGTVMGFRVEDE
jgi:integrase